MGSAKEKTQHLNTIRQVHFSPEKIKHVRLVSFLNDAFYFFRSGYELSKPESIILLGIYFLIVILSFTF